MPTESVLELQAVRFGWEAGHELIHIDHFAIASGESVFLQGPSGSGKSTLLGLIGGVVSPQAGEITIRGVKLVSQVPAARDRIRADHLGIIFQQFNLLPYLTVIDNITLPCLFSRVRLARSRQHYGDPRKEALTLLDRLGLPQAVVQQPVSKLSVGQQQRVAVARALIGGPSLIIADEPTSALDTENRDRFIELLNQQRRELNSSLLFVSHDPTLAKHFDRVEAIDQINAIRVAES
ncbi:MAG: ABC transporter ATP-binding protein [Pseudomonadota bacterium]